MSPTDQSFTNVNKQGEEQYQSPELWITYRYIVQCRLYLIVGQAEPPDKPPGHNGSKQGRRNEVQRTWPTAPLEQQPTYINSEQRGCINESITRQHNGLDKIRIDINPKEYEHG